MLVSDAIKALKLLRESILGLSEIKAQERDWESCAPYAVIGANSALWPIDLFLTDSNQKRDAKVDVSALSIFMSNFERMVLPLSAPGAYLELRETGVDAFFTEETPIGVRRRWNLIRDAEDAQPESLISQPIN